MRALISLARLCSICAVFGVLAWLFLARPFVLPSGGTEAPERTADPARLRALVEKLTSDFQPRDWTHPENLIRASQFIKEELDKTSPNVELQPYRVAGKEYRNVIASFGPAAAPVVIVGAHYDAAGEFPGADDNASGTAGLLELARLLSGETLPMKVELVAFTLEEETPFGMNEMGSAIHAKSLRSSEEKVRLMMSLEMIGYFSDRPGSQEYPLPFLSALYPSKGDFIAVVGPLSFSPAALSLKRAIIRHGGLSAYSINAPRLVPGVTFSDHVSYWDQGFDALMITDTAYNRNPNYHTEHDTFEKLDYQRMSRVITGVYGYLRSVKE